MTNTFCYDKAAAALAAAEVRAPIPGRTPGRLLAALAGLVVGDTFACELTDGRVVYVVREPAGFEAFRPGGTGPWARVLSGAGPHRLVGFLAAEEALCRRAASA